MVPPHPAAGRVALVMVIVLNLAVLRRTDMTDDTDLAKKHTAGALDIRNIIGGLLATTA